MGGGLGRWWAGRAWRRKRRAAEATGARYYGGTGTIHATTELSVETEGTDVVAVWFRCQQLPFHQTRLTAAEWRRAQEMRVASADVCEHVRLTGVEIQEPGDQP